MVQANFCYFKINLITRRQYSRKKFVLVKIVKTSNKLNFKNWLNPLKPVHSGKWKLTSDTFKRPSGCPSKGFGIALMGGKKIFFQKMWETYQIDGF